MNLRISSTGCSPHVDFEKGFIFSLRTILLLNEAISFYSFKISKLLGKGKLNLRTSTSLFKSVKNISVLNVAFSKSVLVLIKNWCISLIFYFMEKQYYTHFFIRTSTLFEKATLRTKMFLTFLKRLFRFSNSTSCSHKVLTLSSQNYDLPVLPYLISLILEGFYHIIPKLT